MLDFDLYCYPALMLCFASLLSTFCISIFLSEGIKYKNQHIIFFFLNKSVKQISKISAKTDSVFMYCSYFDRVD
jgi:hypothetical protein